MATRELLSRTLSRTADDLGFWGRRKLEFAVGLATIGLIPVLVGLWLLPGAATDRAQEVGSELALERTMDGMLGGQDADAIVPTAWTDDAGMNLGTPDGDPTEEPVYDPEVGPGEIPDTDEMADLYEGFASHMNDRNTPDEDE